MTLGLARVSTARKTTTRTKPSQRVSAHFRWLFHCRLILSDFPFSVGSHRDRYVTTLSSREISSSQSATTTVSPLSLIAEPPKWRRERTAPKCSKEVESVQARFIGLLREKGFRPRLAAPHFAYTSGQMHAYSISCMHKKWAEGMAAGRVIGAV
jgi:hypothetical protein